MDSVPDPSEKAPPSSERSGRRLRRGLAYVLVIAGALVIALAFWVRYAASNGPAPRPITERPESVVLVTLDTTRADHLEPYGAEAIETPTLARLAEEGVLFENAGSVAPITLVAHTSILTGLDPPRHGVRNNGTHSVPEEIETLAERLLGEGFRTAAFVSAAVLEERYNLSQGFEVYDDDLSAGRERHPRMVPDRPAEATTRAALDWLDGLRDDETYFLWVHYYDPHAVYSPPPPYRDTYRERLYDGEIAYMDEWLGKLLQHRRVDDRTLVSVMGDHGESFGEHGEQTHALLAYDSTLRIPWLMRFPGGPRGLRLPQTVGQVDLVPTVLDLLDLEPGSGFDGQVDEDTTRGLTGHSLVPLVEGRLPEFERALYAETWLPFYTYGWSKLRVWRQGRYKWIDGPDPELYDTRRDPRELADIESREPGLSHDMARDLREYLEAVGDGSHQATIELDAEAREQLRSLGYLSVGSGDDRDDADRPDPKAMVGVHVGLERARFLERDRLYEAAESELRRVLDRDPTNLAAMIDLANVLGEQNRVEDGVRVIERALELDPAYHRLHMLLANFEIRRGRTEEAFALFDLVIGQDPGSLEARLQKGVHLARLGRLEEARQLLEATLEDHPDSPPLLAVHAQWVLARAGRLEEAEQSLRRALERDPFLVTAWRQLGSVLERSKRPEAAVEAYRQGLEKALDDADLHGRLGMLLARHPGIGDGADDALGPGALGAQAEMHLRESLRLASQPRNEVRISLGAWLAERGRFEEARAQYQAVLEDSPEHPAALNNQALALYRTGRLEEAVEMLETLLEKRPRHADARNNLAAIAIELGRFEVAEQHARKTLELRPDMAEAWNNLGLSLAGRERFEEALPAYRAALERDETYWQARFGLGLALAGAERPRQAAEALELAIRDRPQRPDLHLELGRLYCGPLAVWERCRRHYNAVLRLVPDHPLASELRDRLAAGKAAASGS